MTSHGRNLALRVFKLFDVATIAVCYAFTYSFCFAEEISFASLFSIEFEIKQFIQFVTLLIIWHFIFLYIQLYNTKRIGRWFHEYRDILKCTSLATVALLVFGFFFEAHYLEKPFFILFWCITTATMILGRVALRVILARLRIKGRNQRFVLIVGSGRKAIEFADKVQEKKELGCHVIGFVDDKWVGQDNNGNGHTMLGGFQDVPEILRNNVVDEIIVALPIRSYYSEIEDIVRQCEEQGIIVRFLRWIFPLGSARFRVSTLNDIPVITLYSSPFEDWRIFAKRGIDIVLSSTALVFCLFIFLVVAIIGKLTSPGPVFFIQSRVGYNKRKFNLIKFRTMVENAEAIQATMEHLNETDGPTFKIKKDPRLTKFGKILRKTSIDELPQFINVLKGDMSLVGPRPLPVRDYQGFDEEWQRKRFSVKPGITCFWQVNGRSDISFSKWMEMDVEYIDTWSLSLDFKILLQTIPTVLFGKGAY